MVDSVLGKKYKLATSENFDEFMKAVGVGFITRKAGGAASPVIELVKTGDEYTLTSQSTFKNVTIKFKPNIELDQETPDGRKVKSIFTIDGNTIRERQRDPVKDLVTTIDRTFTKDEVKMVMKVGDITSTRIYKPY